MKTTNNTSETSSSNTTNLTELGLVLGEKLLALREIKGLQNDRDWDKWINAKLPSLSKRARVKYMKLARMSGGEHHFE